MLGVDFNRKVALDTVHYWSKEAGNLSSLIHQVDEREEDLILGQAAKSHMQTHYTWEGIVRQYEDLFLK